VRCMRGCAAVSPPPLLTLHTLSRPATHPGIAFAFAVSSAMEKTKLAAAIANIFVQLSECCAGFWAAALRAVS
jgi:hypothetical protein